ncbi:MAG: TonB-dependent receptor [Acidobacteriota bacterium]
MKDTLPKRVRAIGGLAALVTLNALSLLLILASDFQAQTITGAVTGTVVDTTGAVIPEATVTLKSEGTGVSRKALSNESGFFVFDSVQPGPYAVLVEKPGFKRHEQKGLMLSSGQRLPIGAITLVVGEVTEVLSVTTAEELVSTESAEHSGLLTERQLDVMIAQGRDPVNLLKTLPGVSQVAFVPWGAQADGASGAGALQFGNQSLGGQFGTFTPNIQGVRSYFNNFSLDGQPSANSDILSLYNQTTSIDTISEVKAVLTNYAAEYGGNPGAVVNMVTKSGTKDFHGNAYLYKRHEKLNANNFFNNKFNRARPVYRHSNWGFTVGGPVYIPGRFNTQKDKIFFFFGHDDWGVKQPSGLRQVTLPTEKERKGDFSQTFDQNGALIAIKDPLTGQPFPGNIIPTDRINRNGQGLLSVFPLPNQLDRSVTGGNYNFIWEDILDVPKQAQVLRVDFHPSPKDSFYVRGHRWYTDTVAYEPGAAWSGGAPLLIHHYEWPEYSGQFGYTRVFSPSLVNEFNAGHWGTGEFGDLASDADYNPVRKATFGITQGQLFPEANPLGLIPKMSFGGVPGAASVGYDDRFPIDAGDRRFNLSNNLSWIRGSHSFKFGIYLKLEWTSEGPRSNASASGAYNFGRDPDNPGDTGFAYANAMLGNFAQYSETNKRNFHKGKQNAFEFFAQDTWKATRKLTLSYGVRFSTFSPWLLRGRTLGAALVFDRYDRSQAPAFYVPFRNAEGRRVARAPLTGQLFPAPYIGGLVPGSGNTANGMVLSTDESYPDGFRNRPPLQIGPRFGFAYDVFGNGKTAIRGGFGSTKQTALSSGNFLWELTQNVPVTFQPQIFYGSMDTLVSSQGVLFPTLVSALEREPPVSTVYNYSLGIQHQIGDTTVVGVSYVGNVGRHLHQNRDLNTIVPGARFDPANLDPTTGRALSTNFLRPYPGHAGIKYIDHSGDSNYNSLQMTLNRRFTSGPQVGVSYTWSKSMGLTDGDGGGLPIYLPIRSWMYGRLGFDQTHMLSINYIWDLPKASTRWNNGFVRAVLDNWQMSGITTFASGAPTGINYSTTDNADITGGGDEGFRRVNLVENPIISNKSFDRWFNTNAFARPAKGSFGNAARDLFRGPGVNNWDMTVAKKIPVDELRYFEFRSEFYNAFNHSQWLAVDNNARFDPSGKQVNSRFGQVVAARPARYIQLGVRFFF